MHLGPTRATDLREASGFSHATLQHVHMSQCTTSTAVSAASGAGAGVSADRWTDLTENEPESPPLPRRDFGSKVGSKSPSKSVSPCWLRGSSAGGGFGSPRPSNDGSFNTNSRMSTRPRAPTRVSTDSSLLDPVSAHRLEFELSSTSRHEDSIQLPGKTRDSFATNSAGRGSRSGRWRPPGCNDGWMIDPSAPWLQTWVRALVACLLYNMVSIPFQVG